VLRLFTPFRLLAAAVVFAAAAAATWAVPSDSYIFLPHRTHAVAPLIKAEGGADPRGNGGFYYVDVLVREATLVERLWPGLREGATVVPADEVLPEGVSERQRRREELAEMRRSQRIAAAVALRELGYDVKADPVGARIEAVAADAPAEGRLETGDVIRAVDGGAITGPDELRRAVRSAGTSRSVRLHVERGDDELDVSVRPTRGPEGAPILGVIVSQAADIELPIDVEIDTGNVGGPSAGLAFALGLMEELGRELDRGNRVAVTGSLELDGAVGPIGGMKQKTIAVNRAGFDVFVVPAGENAAEARRHADGIRIVPVRSFQQTLRALATLPVKPQD
jgi:PDZ domain-containing protein